MPIKRATRVSKLAIQSTKQSQQTDLGNFPPQNISRPEVPLVIEQGDSYFTRDSIGSSAFSSRLNNADIPGVTKSLKLCKNEVGKSFSLSPERPVIISTVDLFGAQTSNFEKILKSVDETLQISDFESKLIKADFDYIHNEIASGSQKPIVESLEKSASSNILLAEKAVENFSNLLFSAESFSKSLDIRTNWKNIEDAIKSYHSKFTKKYQFGELNTELSNFGNPKFDTSTKIVSDLQKSVSSNIIGSAVFNALDARISAEGMIFDNGNIQNYSNKSNLEKVAACCEFLSNVMIKTFSQQNEFALPSVEFNGGSIYDPFEMKSESGKVILSHYDSIISPSIQNLTNETLNSFKDKSLQEFSSFIENIKTKNGVENSNGSPIDIFLMMLEKVYLSFSTLFVSRSSNEMNENELLDAVLMRFATKESKRTKEFSNVLRGILLTILTDPDFKFDSSLPEEYDSVNKSESEVEANGTTTKIKSITGTKQLSTKTLDGSSNSSLLTSIFGNNERLSNFPKDTSTRSYLRWLLKKIGEPDDSYVRGNSLFYLSCNFDPDNTFYKEKYIYKQTIDGWNNSGLDVSQITNRAVSVYKHYPKGSSLSENVDARLSNSIATLIGERIKSFGNSSNGLTVGTVIAEFYDQIVSTFEDVYGKKIEEVSLNGLFKTENGTCKKTSIIDVIFEAFSYILIETLDVSYKYEISLKDQIAPTEEGSEIITQAKNELDRLKTEVEEAEKKYEDLQEELRYMTSGSDVYYETLAARDEAYENLKNLRNLYNDAFSAYVIATTSEENLEHKSYNTYYVYPKNSYDKILNFCNLASSITGKLDEGILNASIQSQISQNDFSKFSTILNFNLYRIESNKKRSVAAVLAISDTIKKACDDFSFAIETLNSSFANLQQSIKNDALSVFDAQSVCLASSKLKLFSGIRESQKEAYNIFDVSAAKWFYNNYRTDLSSDKILVAVGLPTGFISNLEKKAVIVSQNIEYLSVEELSLSREIQDCKIFATSRNIQNIFDLPAQIELGSFYPYLKVSIINEIHQDLTIDRIIGSDLISIEKFDFLSGKWLRKSVAECVTELAAIGIEGYKTISIIRFHTLDAIIKSTVRVAAGVDITEETIGTKPAKIASYANDLRTILASSRQDLIPRGNLTLSDFLSPDSNGGYQIVSYSNLAGDASNKTTPSNHSLLIKLLQSGIFTSDSLLERVIKPSAFEKVFFTVLNPEFSSEIFAVDVRMNKG